MNIVVLLPWIALSALTVPASTVSPEPTCGANHTRLLLLVDLSLDTNLTITRLKNIVSHFITKVKNGVIKTLDVCLVDPFQGKTLFNLTKVNSSQEITSAIDQLVKSNVSSDDYDKSLDDTTQLTLAFEYSTKVISNELDEHKEHVAVVLSSCHGSCANFFILNFDRFRTSDLSKIITLLEVGSKIDPKSYTDEYVFLYDYIRIDVVYIDSKDDFHSYNPVNLDHCKDCPENWTQYTYSGHRISCYWIDTLDTALSWLNASSLCQSVKSSLPAIETEDELTFLIEHLLNKTTFTKADLNVTETTTTAVVNVGLLKRFVFQKHHYIWSNLRPFNLEASFESSDDSKYRCVAFSVSFKAWNWRDKIKWKTVNCDDVISRILVCEMEGRLIHDFDQQLTKILNATQSNQHGQYKVMSGELTSVLDEKLAKDWGMFYCKDGGDNVVTYRLVCDGSRDCNNGRDEQYCHVPSTNKKHSEYLCVNPNGVGDYPTRTSIPSEARCNMIQDCPDNSDEHGCDRCLGRQCHDRTCLPGHWLSRDHEKCHLHTGTNGIVYLNVSYPCKGNCSGLVQFNHEISFCNKNITFEHYSEGQTFNKHLSSVLEWSSKCLYLRGSDGSLTGCHNKYHLRDCSTFQCPEGFLKCPDSYCVPVYNYGDGILDCPYGEDEDTTYAMFNAIAYLFSCRNQFIYIHIVHICDGVPQCPYGDDESYCKVTCPRGFKCNGHAVEVGNNTLVPEIKSLNIFDIKNKFLNISGVDLSKLGEIFIFPNLLEIHATNCNIKYLGKFFSIEYEILYLYTANFSYNNLTVLNNFGPLSRLSNLQFLNLSHNKHLSKVGYYGIMSPKLHTLDLSFTGISVLHLYVLEEYKSIRLLILSNTNIAYVGSLQKITSLEFLNVQETSLSTETITQILNSVSVTSALYVDNYKYCCPQISNTGTPRHACHAPPEAFSSCEDLLSDSFKRSLLWLVAVVSLAGNIVVITYRLFYDRGVFKKGYGIFVTNLSVSDFIMGVYLLIIASTDVHYRDVYVLRESFWRHSALCQAAGFLSTLSSETSTFFVFLITLDRCLVIRFPFGDHRFSKLGLIISVLTAWILGFLLAAVPLMYPDWIIYSSNGMCLGLPMGSGRNLGWHYAFGMFICLNFMLFLFLACGQMFIFRSISSGQSFQMSNDMSVVRRSQDISVAKQLLLVVLSNFLCWFPICVVGILSLTGYSVSPDTYAWLVVFVMPLNAAVNPMIYTIPVMYSKWQDFKKGGNTWTQTLSQPTNQQLLRPKLKLTNLN